MMPTQNVPTSSRLSVRLSTLAGLIGVAGCTPASSVSFSFPVSGSGMNEETWKRGGAGSKEDPWVLAGVLESIFRQLLPEIMKPLLSIPLMWGVVAKLKPLEIWCGHFLAFGCWASI